ncbi:MAG: alcohol dehydrogenase catalytic domain-containing protein [Dehalococcoidales bacterium]
MIAVGMLRGKPGVHVLEVPRPEIKQPDEVLLRVKEVGVDGTDLNMLGHNLQDIAPGRNEIVIGHEMVGVVEAVGSGVESLATGDVVVMTVRRGCGICPPCLHNQSDMCMTGLYTERGIHKRDGFLTEFVVDREQYVVKVPAGLARLAIFTEPLSIVEKGIEQIRIIQSRLPWACPHPGHTFLSENWGDCKVALVVGAGPLGLLATALLRLSQVSTCVADIVPEDSLKAHLVRHMGVSYIDSSEKTPKELVELCCTAGNLDIIFEAAGAAATAVELINYMSRSSIYVMTGIPRRELFMQLDAAQLVRQIVRSNQVVVGSVNSNRSHFEMALKDMPDIEARFKGMLAEMITHRFRLSDYQQAFAVADERHIKTVIEVEPWK